MIKEIISFADTELEVHTTSDDKQWYMTVEEVARAYGVERTAIMHNIRNHADEIREGIEKGVNNCHTPGGPQEKTVIYREGVIKLGFFMRGERAKAFRQFATDLVIQAFDRAGNSSTDGFIKALEQMEKRFENKFESIGDKFESMGDKFKSVENNFESMGDKFKSVENNFVSIDNLCRGIRDEVDELRATLSLLISDEEAEILRELIRKAKTQFNCDGRTLVGRLRSMFDVSSIYGTPNTKKVINCLRNLMGNGIFGIVKEEEKS